MHRRTICLLLCLLTLTIPLPLAQASGPTFPDRTTFSLGYDRLQSAIQKERPIAWQATVALSEATGLTDGATEAMAAMLGALTLSGTVQSFRDGGGFLSAALSSGETEIAAISQMQRDGRVGLLLCGEWFSVKQGNEAQAIASLSLGELEQSLLTLDYAGLRAGDTPFLSPIYRQGIRLWELASPYAEDNNRLRVPSGSTSHGLTYSIDTMDLRAILDAWVDGLTFEEMSLGLPGSSLSVGIGQDALDAFAQKARLLADTVELSKPITLNMTFGEGDVLRSAKGSGTLLEGTKRTPISYAYSCSLSNTRITRKYSIDFQPREGDTLVLSCTALTSSNNAKSGAEELTINASGRYDGKQYSIKLRSEMVNKYALDANGRLTEALSGTLTLVVKYDGQTVLDLSVKRKGQTDSSNADQAVSIAETFDIKATSLGSVLFGGQVGLSLSTGTEDDAALSQEEPKRMEVMDFSEVEALRARAAEAAAQARQRLITALPASVLEAMFSAY